MVLFPTVDPETPRLLYHPNPSLDCFEEMGDSGHSRPCLPGYALLTSVVQTLALAAQISTSFQETLEKCPRPTGPVYLVQRYLRVTSTRLTVSYCWASLRRIRDFLLNPAHGASRGSVAPALQRMFLRALRPRATLMAPLSIQDIGSCQTGLKQRGRKSPRLLQALGPFLGYFRFHTPFARRQELWASR